MIDQLTKRQREVLALTACGMRRAEVAAHCFLSEFTVRNALEEARERLGAATTAHAIALAIATEQIVLSHAGQVAPAKTFKELDEEYQKAQAA